MKSWRGRWKWENAVKDNTDTYIFRKKLKIVLKRNVTHYKTFSLVFQETCF